MKEKIAKLIYGNPQYRNCKELSPYTTQLIDLLREEIEKVKNPYNDCKLHTREGFEACRQKILDLLSTSPKE